MRYADMHPKKVAMLLLVALVIGIGVSTTASLWETRVTSSFSLANVGYAINDFGMTTWYRIEYNSGWLLAFVGLAGSTHFTAAATGPAQSIPVLLYHGISSASDSTSTDVTTLDNFKNQMFALKADGWQTVSMEDFVAAMKGDKVLPPKSFLLTFDDARQDAFLNATPVLQALDYKATMFVITGRSLGPNNSASSYYATKDQLKQMLASGVWELESHSGIGHVQYPVDASGNIGDFYGNELWVPPPLTGESPTLYEARIYGILSDYFHGQKYPLEPGVKESVPQYQARITDDLVTAQTALKDGLGVSAIAFSYPYNDFAQDLKTDSADAATPGLVNIVNQIYSASFFQWYPSLGFTQNYPGADKQLLKRIEPRPNWTPEHLLGVLEGGEPKSLPYTMTKENMNWSPAWGNVTSTSDGKLMLSASTSTAGAYTLLDGSRLWGDYDYETTVNWDNAESLVLYAHYVATPLDVSYLACNFASNGSVALEDHENGTITVLAKGNYYQIGQGEGKRPGMDIAGNYAGCLWNGGTITYAHIPSGAPSAGGIGIEAWNHGMNNANVTVTAVNVVQQP